MNTPRNIAYKRLLDNRKNHVRFNISDESFESAVKEMEVPTHEEGAVFSFE